jgi:cob(I)alamin adenosyltransferase
MKIYTKTGDKGKTRLCGGKEVLKDSMRVTAYGELDELSSNIGLALAFCKNTKIKSILIQIQKDLFVLSAHIASPSKDLQDTLPKFPKTKIKNIEKLIDDISLKLKPLKKFILPGGTKLASFLHVARTVCRRAERTCISLSQKENIFEYAIPYLNRLSDLLFVLARYANKGNDFLMS